MSQAQAAGIVTILILSISIVGNHMLRTPSQSKSPYQSNGHLVFLRAFSGPEAWIVTGIVTIHCLDRKNNCR